MALGSESIRDQPKFNYSEHGYKNLNFKQFNACLSGDFLRKNFFHVNWYNYGNIKEALIVTVRKLPTKTVLEKYQAEHY